MLLFFGVVLTTSALVLVLVLRSALRAFDDGVEWNFESDDGTSCLSPIGFMKWTRTNRVLYS